MIFRFLESLFGGQSKSSRQPKTEILTIRDELRVPANIKKYPGPHGKFEDYRWGDPPPSKKMFGYACSLGAPIKHGMRKYDVSRAIDLYKDETIPADKTQRAELRKLKIEVPKDLTAGQAERALDLLNRCFFQCPKCKRSFSPWENKCDSCRADLKTYRVRIVLE